MTDPLFEAILADPDNDDPRLVWADREGGTRGELVVVQCKLATPAPRAERKALLRREAELLTETGLGDGFVRGFREHCTVGFAEIADAAAHAVLFARAPLLRSIALSETRLEGHEYWPLPDWSYVATSITRAFALFTPDRIQRVRATPQTWIDGEYPETYDEGVAFLAALANTAAGRALRSIEIGGTASLASLEPFREIEELSATVDFGLGRFGDLHTTHPKLRRLSVRAPRADGELDTLLAHPLASQLETLDLGGNRLGDSEIVAIAACPRLSRLSHLGVQGATFGLRGFEALTASPHLAQLRVLDLRNVVLDDARAAMLARATFAPSLRILSVEDGGFTDTAIPQLASLPELTELLLRGHLGSKKHLAALAEVIPRVAKR